MLPVSVFSYICTITKMVTDVSIHNPQAISISSFLVFVWSIIFLTAGNKRIPAGKVLLFSCFPLNTITHNETLEQLTCSHVLIPEQLVAEAPSPLAFERRARTSHRMFHREQRTLGEFFILGIILQFCAFESQLLRRHNVINNWSVSFHAERLGKRTW